MRGQDFTRHLDLDHLDELDDELEYGEKTVAIRPHRPSDFRNGPHASEKRQSLQRREKRQSRINAKHGETDED